MMSNLRSLSEQTAMYEKAVLAKEAEEIDRKTKEAFDRAVLRKQASALEERIEKGKVDTDGYMAPAHGYFETYSDAGFLFDGEKYVGATKNKRGLPLVGAAAYAEHYSTEVLSLAYDLKDGAGPRLWVPGLPYPQELFDYITAGGLIEAHNSGFEFFVWFYVCHCRMGWPFLAIEQLRCSMAKAKA